MMMIHCDRKKNKKKQIKTVLSCSSEGLQDHILTLWSDCFSQVHRFVSPISDSDAVLVGSAGCVVKVLSVKRAAWPCVTVADTPHH